MIVYLIFAASLAVGRNSDAAVELVAQRSARGRTESHRRVLAQR